MSDNTCFFKKCKEPVAITYLNKPLCDKHWNLLSEKSIEESKELLGIKKKENKNNEMPKE